MRRVSGRGVVAGFVVAGLSLSVIGSPAPAAASPELGAVNVFSAERTAYTTVRIPRDTQVELDFFRTETLKVKGDGRFAGLFLIRQDVDKTQGLYGGTFRVCDRKACADGWSGWVTRFLWPVGLKWEKKEPIVTLPAGIYRAYVVTDGAPVIARLSLPNLQGEEQQLEATTPADADIGMQRSGLPQSNLFAAGSTYELGSRGVAIMGFVERHTASSADVNIDCLYEGEPSLPAPIAYTPACAAAGAEVGGGASQSFPPLVGYGSSGWFSMRSNMPAGTWSWGGTYAGAQRVQDAAFVSVWLGLGR